MRMLVAARLLVVVLLLPASCQKADVARASCSNAIAVKCSVLGRVTSPSRDYEAVTKIDSYGGGFGTGYDSADVYINRIGTSKEDTLLFSIEDNADDLSTKNFVVSWRSSDELLIRYGHGDVTFQMVKFAGKTVSAVQDATLDQVAHQ